MEKELVRRGVSKEGKDNSQVDGKNKCLVNKYLSCHADTMGHRVQFE